MMTYNSFQQAGIALHNSQHTYIPKRCPHRTDESLCGNWCPAFYESKAKGMDNRIILQCFPNSVCIHVEG